MATWRQLIIKEMTQQGESWCDVEHLVGDKETFDKDLVTIGAADWLDVEFDNGLGCRQGCHFTVWTRSRVYFPVTYDGSEWVASVPRNPCRIATEHVGA